MGESSSSVHIDDAIVDHEQQRHGNSNQSDRAWLAGWLACAESVKNGQVHTDETLALGKIIGPFTESTDIKTCWVCHQMVKIDEWDHPDCVWASSRRTVLAREASSSDG